MTAMITEALDLSATPVTTEAITIMVIITIQAGVMVVAAIQVAFPMAQPQRRMSAEDMEVAVAVVYMQGVEVDMEVAGTGGAAAAAIIRGVRPHSGARFVLCSQSRNHP
jgi:hypothetical protein